MPSASPLIDLAATLRDRVDGLRFAPPVAVTYNPLRYAWAGHAAYLERYGQAPKRVVFLGMNPGPFGMAQTGVPFGEITAVRNWLRISTAIGKPPAEHPKRPITGFACTRAEVSGKRLWGLFAQRFGTPEAFFAEHLVLSYCPLLWMSDSGANLTPDKLPAAEQAAFDRPCLEHLRAALQTLRPAFAVGIGAYATKKLTTVTRADDAWTIAQVPHPSPANPGANHDWAGAATSALTVAGVWP